jgi:hypothetical protein
VESGVEVVRIDVNPQHKKQRSSRGCLPKTLVNLEMREITTGNQSDVERIVRGIEMSKLSWTSSRINQ